MIVVTIAIERVEASRDRLQRAVEQRPVMAQGSPVTEPLTLTEEQKPYLRELVSAHPAGLIFNDGRTKERRVFDSLAERGAVKAIAVEGGRGYCLTPEVAIAFGNSAARKGAQAEWN